MRNRKKKPVSLPGMNAAVEYAAATVDDPFDDGKLYKDRKPLRLVKNIRTHPLDYLLHHGRISGAQFDAGNKFLKIYEKCEIGCLQSLDYERIRVDVSYVHRGVPDEMANAVQRLAAVRAAPKTTRRMRWSIASMSLTGSAAFGTGFDVAFAWRASEKLRTFEILGSI